MNPWNCNLPGSPVRGISQARLLEWVAMSFSRGSSQARDPTRVSCISRRILYHRATWEALHGGMLYSDSHKGAQCLVEALPDWALSRAGHGGRSSWADPSRVAPHVAHPIHGPEPPGNHHRAVESIPAFPPEETSIITIIPQSFTCHCKLPKALKTQVFVFFFFFL